MDRELIHSWLQLPPGNWPPDHYTLLGLEPGDGDVAHIEQHVHERMQRLRSYQLTHPELATEAMNCLAQALVCLTDPEAKSAYDRHCLPSGAAEASMLQAPAADLDQGPVPVSAALRGTPMPMSELAASSSNGAAEPHAPGPLETVVPTIEDQRFFDWQFEPPPQRQPRGMALPSSFDFMSRETLADVVLPGLGVADTSPEVPPVPPLESPVLAAEDDLPSKFSRLELRSKGALYYQIARVRQLLWAWEQIGKYLSRPTRLVSRPEEATDLIHHMGVVRELLPFMTPLMGEAGHPGYLVLALARQQMIVPTLQTLLPSQREALARDWQTGHALLRSVRQFLRQELHVVRRRRGWRHALRLIGASLRDHPGVVLLLVGLVAVNLASPGILKHWPEQLIFLTAFAAFQLARWFYMFQPLRLPAHSRPERKVHVPKKGARRQRQPDSFRA